MTVTTLHPLANQILLALQQEQERIVTEEIEKVKGDIERRLREVVAKVAFRLHENIQIDRRDTNLVITVSLDGKLS